MSSGSVDRRRGKRVEVQALCRIRRPEHPASDAGLEQVTANISLAGVYFESEQLSPWSVNDVVMASVAVPESQRRLFPFTRLSGRCRVVRVQPLQSPQSGGPARVGVALEFGGDVTALTAIPARG